MEMGCWGTSTEAELGEGCESIFAMTNVDQSPDDTADLIDDILLNPLRDLITKFAPKNSDTDGNPDTKKTHRSFASRIFDASSRSLGALKVPEVHIKELYEAWKDQLIGSFGLSHIEYFRDKVGSHHEYLIINVGGANLGGPNSGDLWLRLERRPMNCEGKRERIASVIGGLEANDTVAMSRRREDLLVRENMERELRATGSFLTTIPLKYILEVLNIIHDNANTYSILGGHCWFFASTIVDALELKAHINWEQIGDHGWRDHWKTKSVNKRQYEAIMDRIKGLVVD
ncbi:hypothetical protein FS749_011009 [Ceratobasidium sp. UAMH 11750]|nr:hypothetical protein FS749_011009 [Ceratobasidium sp. UAMH 11750]